MDTTSTFKGTGFEVFELFVGHKAFLLNPLLLPPPYSRKRSIEEAVRQADLLETEWIDHADVSTWLKECEYIA
jgi:hypothetical protein